MKTVSAAGTLCILLFASGPLGAGDWPNWRGPAHDGISSETGWQSVWPSAGPRLLWKARVGTGFASAAVSGGRVYTLGNAGDQDTVFCFDVNTGDTVWTHSYKQKLAPKYYEGGPSATPTVEGNRVYTFSKSGLVLCLDAASGKVIWQKFVAADLNLEEPTWGFAGSVLVQGDLVILNAGDSGIALNKQSGEVVWSSGAGPSGYSTPVPFLTGAEPCVALMGKEDLLAVRVKDGSVLWRFPWKTQYDVNAADPIVIGGDRFFITSGYGHGCALIQVSGGEPTLVWENKNMSSQMSGGVLWQGHVYGIDDKQLRCLSLETGEVKWTEKSVGKGSLMLADGKLIVLGEKGELYCAETSPAGFKVISRAQVLGGKCWTTPVLSNGRIYCRNAKGDFVCLDVGAK
jgi:outer membrane protein assembly factor BamB